MNLCNLSQELAQASANFLRDVKQKLELIGSTDNSEISRINENCYTVNASTVNKHQNLSPEYYDFKKSCELIVEKLPNNPEILHDFLQVIVFKKKIPGYRNPFNQALHPELIQLLKLHYKLFDLSQVTDIVIFYNIKKQIVGLNVISGIETLYDIFDSNTLDKNYMAQIIINHTKSVYWKLVKNTSTMKIYSLK